MWRNIAYALILSTLQLTISGSMYGWPSLSAAIKNQGILSEPDATVSWIFTSAIIVRTTLGPILGLINDKFSPKILLIISCLLSSSGAILLFVANSSLAMWIIGYIIYGIGSNGVNLAVLTSAKDLFPNYTIQYISIMNGLNELSTLWFTFLSAIGAEIRYFFLAISILGVVASIVGIWKPDSIWDNRMTVDKNYRLYFSELFKTILNLHYILYNINHIIVFFWTVYYLGSLKPRMDLSAITTEYNLIAIFSIVLAISGFVLSFIIGPIISKIGLRKSWLIVYVLLLLWTATLIIPKSVASIIINFILFSLAKPMYYSVAFNYLAKQYGYGLLGRLISICFFFTTPFIFAQSPLLQGSVALRNFWLSDGIQVGTILLSVVFLIYTSRKISN